MEFLGKTALITGGSSGLGLLCSWKFVEAGGNVLMVGRNESVLAEKVAEINAVYPGRAAGFAGDVRNYEHACQSRDEAVRCFGSIDLLVHFAGGAERRMLKVPSELDFVDTPIEVYDWGIDVNLKGQLYFDHAVLKQMREQRSGVIIHIGSITGEEGSPRSVAYSTSKSGAMYGLTKSIAQYGGQFGVRCCCVSPGPVLTREAMGKMKTLMGRAAEPEEIVDLILYLASDKGAFVTGTNFLIDGGRNVMFNKG